MSAVSSILKHTPASTRRRAPFRSSGWFASSNPGSLVIVSGQELGPTHASHRSLTAIMITTSDSSMKRSGIPNQYLGVLLHTMAISGLSRVRTELFQLLVIPFLTHHPEQVNGEPTGHCNLRNLPSPPQHQV